MKKSTKNPFKNKILISACIEFYFALTSVIIMISGILLKDSLLMIVGAVETIIFILLGIGLILLKRIARTLVLIFSWITLITSIYSFLDIIYKNLTHEEIFSIFSYIFIIIKIILVIIIIYFLQNKKVKEYFK